MATYVPNGRQQFCDANGNPLSGGSVGMYIPGTLTLTNTWQDSGQTTLNSNPIPLDSGGFASIYGVGTYRQIVKDALGNTIWDRTADSTGGIGYVAGQGGTVVQPTSKSTDIILNALTGQITTNNASLAANGTVSFNVNNSFFGNNDLVHVNIKSGTTTANAYLVQADNLGSNVFRISLTNRTAGALAEALVISFCIFKGQVS
jgi:hypothetical protein